MLLGQSDLLPLVAVVGLGLAIAMLLMRGTRARRRNSDDRWKHARPLAGEPARAAGEPAELHRWEVQMHETARELSARLDTKMSALRALIVEADRTAARLERAKTDATPGSGTSDPL